MLQPLRISYKLNLMEYKDLLKVF